MPQIAKQLTPQPTSPWVYRACHAILTFLAIACFVAGIFVVAVLLSTRDASPAELPPCAPPPAANCTTPDCATLSALDDCDTWDRIAGAHHYEVSVNGAAPFPVDGPPLRVTPSAFMPASRTAEIRVRAVERDDVTGAELPGEYSNVVLFDSVVACVSQFNCRTESDASGNVDRVCDGCESPCVNGAARFLSALPVCP